MATERTCPFNCCSPRDTSRACTVWILLFLSSPGLYVHLSPTMMTSRVCAWDLTSSSSKGEVADHNTSWETGYIQGMQVTIEGVSTLDFLPMAPNPVRFPFFPSEARTGAGLAEYRLPDHNFHALLLCTAFGTATEIPSPTPFFHSTS